MKTIKFKVYLAMGLNKEEDELEIEVPDDATEEQIEEEKDHATMEWTQNYLDISHD